MTTESSRNAAEVAADVARLERVVEERIQVAAEMQARLAFARASLASARAVLDQARRSTETPQREAGR